jgi:DNA-binding MltR family transcriptional regulator
VSDLPPKPTLAQRIAKLGEGIRNLAQQTHVGVVLTAAQVLTNELENCIVARMPSINTRLRKSIFTGYGPLSTFSARIDVAFSLGIFEEAVFKRLHAVRALRNSLAHSPQIKSLDDCDAWPKLLALVPEATGTSGQSIDKFVAVIAIIDKSLRSALDPNLTRKDAGHAK